MGDDLIRTRWRYDYLREVWINGDCRIGIEEIRHLGRGPSQDKALRLTGELLPEDAFPRPLPPIVQALDGARLMGIIAP